MTLLFQFISTHASVPFFLPRSVPLLIIHITFTSTMTISTRRLKKRRCYTLTRGSSQVELCAQNIFSFHLLFRAMSHDQHSAPSMLYSFSLSSTSPSFTGSGSMLITSRMHCADSRDLGGDGFTDPEPRTGCEPQRIVDNPIVTEQEIEHSSERFQKLRLRAKS